MAHYIYKTVFGHSIVWQCRFCLSSSHHVVQTGRYLIPEIVYKVINYNLKNYIENGGKHGCIATISKKHMTIYSLLGRQMGEHLHFDPVNTRIPNTLMMKMLPAYYLITATSIHRNNLRIKIPGSASFVPNHHGLP